YEGITVFENCIIRDCTASFNTENGIEARGACTIIGCSSYGNVKGITAGENCIVRDCTAFSNTWAGIMIGDGGAVKECSVARNADGILTGTGSRVDGCTANKNAIAGILVDAGSTVANCTSRDNLGAGVQARFGGGVRIEDNNVTANLSGINADGPSFVLRNTA